MSTREPHKGQLYTLASSGSADTILCLLCSFSLPSPPTPERSKIAASNWGTSGRRRTSRAHPLPGSAPLVLSPVQGGEVTTALNELKAMTIAVSQDTNFGTGDSMSPWDFYYLRGTKKFSGPPTLKTSYGDRETPMKVAVIIP